MTVQKKVVGHVKCGIWKVVTVISAVSVHSLCLLEGQLQLSVTWRCSGSWDGLVYRQLPNFH